MTHREMKALRPGQIIVSPAGSRRTVISVSHFKGRTSVAVPIMHCSWTHRTYTILDRQMLKYYSATRKRIEFKRYRLGRLVLKDQQGQERHGDCCDVVGVFQ